MLAVDTRTQDKVKNYKNQIWDCLVNNSLHDLENILNEIVLNQAETPEANKIYTDLRLEIIHWQIAIQHSFKFKAKQKEEREKLA